MTRAKERHAPTKRQRQVLDAITRFRRERGFSPTVREIGHFFGWSSTNAVVEHLKRLRDKGLVTWEEQHSRTIREIGGNNAG